MGVNPNPTFTTEDGFEFHLKPIPVMVFNFWQSEWRKRNPPPTPPVREVMIVNTPTRQTDPQDPYYQMALAEWEGELNTARMIFVYSRGVKDEPPKDWKADPETVPENPTAAQIKALWIMSLVMTEGDLKGLTDSIISLTMPTVEAIENAQKK